jgi:hypothetical protein
MEERVRKVRCQGGYTLVEALVTSTLMVIVLIPLYTLFTTSQVTYNKGVDASTIQQDAREALQWVTRDIRTAGYESPDLANPACASPKAPTCVLPTRQAAKVGLRADVDGDGVTEEVEYELQNCVGQTCDLVRRERDWDGATLTWGAWSPYEVIARNVEGLTFTYLPAAGPRRVQVQVNVRDTGTAPDVAFMVVSDIRLRNL